MSRLLPPAPVILQGASGQLEFRGLNFASLNEPTTMLCTECFCRKSPDLFGDTDDICNDCKEIYGL